MLPDTGFLRIKEVLALIPVGRSTLWARVKAGTFPKPIKLGTRTTAWKAEDIREFIHKAGSPLTTTVKAGKEPTPQQKQQGNGGSHG